MTEDSYTIKMGDFHYIQSLFWDYEIDLELKNVKITQHSFTFSLTQLNRLYTQTYDLYKKLSLSANFRQAELLLKMLNMISAKIVQANREIAEIKRSK